MPLSLLPMIVDVAVVVGGHLGEQDGDVVSLFVVILLLDRDIATFVDV